MAIFVLDTVIQVIFDTFREDAAFLVDLDHSFGYVDLPETLIIVYFKRILETLDLAVGQFQLSVGFDDPRIIRKKHCDSFK